MTMRKAIPVLLGMLLLSACKDLVVPDFNNPSIDELTQNPTRVALMTATQGLFVDARAGIAGRAGYVSELGILGRESYNFDAADPRFATELLRDPLDGGNGAFGGNHWTARYGSMRDAYNVLNAVDAVPGLTASEQEGIRGIAKTFQALDLLLVVNTRDDLGAVVTLAADPTGPPEPIVDRTAVFNAIVSLLNQADGHLANAGADFPSDLSFPSGFAGFDDPGSFREFNRGLKARVDVYMGNYNDALTSLGASFLDPAAALTLGPKHSFGTGSGDVTNGLFDPSNLIILAHPSIETDAQTQTGGALDQRYLSKIVDVPSVDDQGGLGLSSDKAFTMYASATSAVPIIRNEELILLRAEANIQLGNDVAALTDINFIRTTAGSLPAIAQGTWNGLSLDEQVDELLYNRRYSLLFEGHRWVDMRRYGRLSDLLLVPSLVVHPRFPFPQSECNARNPQPSQGC